MKYEILYADIAQRQLKKLPNALSEKIVKKIKLLSNDLYGDVKKLTDYSNGKDFVLVPEENFREIQEKIEDAEDLRLLRAARHENEGKPMLTHREMMRELGLEE
jgi:hypothetical protein